MYPFRVVQKYILTGSINDVPYEDSDSVMSQV